MCEICTMPSGGGGTLIFSTYIGWADILGFNILSSNLFFFFFFFFFGGGGVSERAAILGVWRLL